MQEEPKDHEDLVRQLNDPLLRAEYARPYDHYHVGLTARVLGKLFIYSGNLLYGRTPSYAKFKAIEVIARIPYQSWESASYTLLSAFYWDEAKAMRLTRTGAFSRMAQDNETMHVVVVAGIVRRLRAGGVIRHTIVPLMFSFLYFWIIYLLYMLHPKAALELNFMFECHAHEQYQEFLDRESERLKSTPVISEFLAFYGREARSEYELFESIRNDELIHRNRTIRELEAMQGFKAERK